MLGARLPTIVLALLCGVFAVYLALSGRREATLQRAQADLVAGRSAEALAELKDVEGETDGRAAALRGYAYRDIGRLEPARRAFQTAARRDPNNWVLQREYARILLRLGERSKARARMSRAKALNPRMLLPSGFVGVK